MEEDRDRVREEGNMSKAEEERQDVGLSPEEVRKINRLRSLKGDAFKKKVRRAANVLAAGITAVAGVGLAGTVQEALKNAPPPIVRENSLPQPKPPEGVVFPENTQASEPVLTKRVFVPLVTKEHRENPYLTREFGAPERGVIMRNKVEQGGGNPAHVEMGDQELFENMMYLRERWGRPDLKVEVTFYSSWDLLDRTPGRPDYDPRNRSTFGLVPWESYAGSNGTFRTGGAVLFRYREADKTIERHIVLPEVLPGKIPTQIELYAIHSQFVHGLQSMIGWTNEDRSTTVPLIRPGDPVSQDLRDHPIIIYGEGQVKQSFVWIRMETIPSTNGK